MAESKKKSTTRKATERKPARKTTTTRAKKRVEITHEQIAECAYFLSLERRGDAFENWLQAERELQTA